MIALSKILVVDDEPSVCRSCRDMLAKSGWEVETAFSGRECIDRTRNKAFDVVILDLRIPDIGGTQLLREIKRRHPETYVIVITGYSSVASAVETMKIGAFDYIPKPFTPDQIRKAVERATEIHAADTTEKEGRIIHRDEVIKVLERASSDMKFIAQLTEDGSKALDDYKLSWEERAALLSGDIQWIEKHIGKLTDDQKIWLNCRLQQERW